MTPSDPRTEADEAARTAEQEAKRAGEEVRAAARDVREHAADAVRDAGRIAREEANARADRATDAAAAEARRAARAADDAAGDYPDDVFPARALEGVSAFLEDTADSLRSADLESVAQDVTRFAHRNPLTFLAGAAAVGFAAARLARAAPPRDSHDFDDDGLGYASGDEMSATSVTEAPESPMTPEERGSGRSAPNHAPAQMQAEQGDTAAAARAGGMRE